MNILGVKIDDVSLEEAIDIVDQWLAPKNSRTKYLITTPNPEFLVLAASDPEFKRVLNQSDLAIPDGIGLKLSGQVKNRTTGVDLMVRLCHLAEVRGFTVGFLGGRNMVALRSSERLKKLCPKLKVVLAEAGPEVNENGEQISEFRIKNPVEILFVGFGMGKQEKWIVKNRDKSPFRVAMGVGGSFDYLSGTVRRAPNWLRLLGLEWLFRLILQPWRAKRQIALLRYLIWISKDILR